MTAPKPVILGIDEDRPAQGGIAQAFNQQGVFYRFVTDRRKVGGGIRQLKPDLLIVFGDMASDFVIQVLDKVSTDAATSGLPIVCVSNDLSDAPFVSGLRTGVVAVIAPPFTEAHIQPTKMLWEDLSSRPGTVSGTGDSKTLQRLIDHIRRTRRSGVVTLNARTPNEAKASFVLGKLQRAAFLGAAGPDALKHMLALPKATWAFTEVAGQSGDGAGVVINVGDSDEAEEILTGAEVGPDDETQSFEVSPTAPPPPAPVHDAEPVPGNQVRLLLVDDDESLLRMFSTLFSKHGFNVTTASDGQQGADIALQREFDLVFADLNMPHLDGWGMLRVLREDFRTRELPIAFISAHDDYRESLRALNAGAQAYLSKGTRLDALITQAKKMLEPRQTVLASLMSGQATDFAIASVGPQWTLRQLAVRYLSGRLDVKDGWASYTLIINGGTCIAASAIAGKYRAEGERAFNAFIASRAAEGAWLPGAQPGVTQTLFLSTEVLLERACATLNENERRVRENLLVSATQLEVNQELYSVYRQVGPKQYLEPARLICEERLPPREVIARLDASPVDIEETMKDLLRRGVVVLRRAA
ncbi:MAG: response regulator [Archangium sp.]|nr:response regulator [Archangium sp.]